MGFGLYAGCYFSALVQFGFVVVVFFFPFLFMSLINNKTTIKNVLCIQICVLDSM